MLYSALFATICFLLTCLGASMVFFVKRIGIKFGAFLYSFSAGIMISSAIFSLIVPSIEYCTELNIKAYIVLPICFVLAYIIYAVIDKFTISEGNINVKSVAIGMALHNIPEGMCIGFAFASASLLPNMSLTSAMMIAVGIGIQNIPEGGSLALPLRAEGRGKFESFIISAIVGLVEVPASILACTLGLKYLHILPYMLAFAAAIMIYVACLELMPNASKNNSKMALFGLFFGMTLMMILDLAL